MALIVSVLMLNSLFAESQPPKREFRGVWLSTVANIDWPKSKYDSDIKKQNDLRNYLSKMAETGINAVLMQVRCSCDAMYKSDIEPWSYWFSGVQGQGPSIDWDPLAFAVKEAHERELELHAWVNPYRAVVSPSSVNDKNYISNQHITKQHPEWILKFSDVHILDPGIPEVRDYILNVLMDIVNRYDIDGLHMDDYFYPYSGITTEDASTFENYSRGFTDIHNWRRDNINLLVQAVMDSINEVKPWVKWGISPFGIYRPGVPPGISGMDAYSVLYCDPIAWLAAQSVDYITPQCYWPFGGGQDYGKLIPWWAGQAEYYGRHFYPGQGLYRAATWDRGEVPRQIRLNRETEYCDGSVFFTANDFYDNAFNTIDSMRLDLYKYPSLWPVMSWKDTVPPDSPQNVQFAIEGDGTRTITWDAPAYLDPADSAYAYVVYRAPYPVDISNMTSAVDIQFHQEHMFEDPVEDIYYYAVTALDRNKLESVPEHIKYDFVDPLFPEYADKSTPVEFPMKWGDYPGAASYTLEISSTNDFSSPLQQYTLSDTSKYLVLEYQNQYYWRVIADNTTFWSPVWTFTTQLPPQVSPVLPFAYYEGTGLNPQLAWNLFEDASTYHLQVSEDKDMSNLLIDEPSLTDTIFHMNSLDYATTYHWRIRSNKYDRWSDVRSFVTKEEFVTTVWEKTSLAQSYPAFMDSSLEASGLALGKIGQDDVLLLLQSFEDSIKVDALDAHTGNEYSFELNLNGISGGLHYLRDIEISSDGVIYASNCVDEGDTLKIYQWLDPAQPAECIYQAEDIAYRIGDHIAVTGRYDDSSVNIYTAASNYNKMIKLTLNNVSREFEAEQISLGRVQKDLASVALIPGSDELYVNSSGYTIRKFSPEGTTLAIMGSDNGMLSSAHALAGFKYQDKPYLVSYSQTTESAYIVDIYDGINGALYAGKTYKLGMKNNASSTGDVEVMDNGDGTFTIFVLGNQNGIAAYEYDAAAGSVGIAQTDLPGTFELGQNYPNPFNPVTIIPIELHNDSYVEISVYGLNGKLIKTLFTGELPTGTHKFNFNGSGLSSGQYLYRLSVGDVAVTRKMLLIK